MKKSAPKRVGIQELRGGLSDLLQQVKAGAEVIVTERGQPIVRLSPVNASDSAVFDSAGIDWMWEMVAKGKATWGGPGRKPKGARISLTPGESLSDVVIEQRRARPY